jgi:hypothetical protein
VFFALLVVFDVLAHLAENQKEKARLLEKIGLWCFGIAVLSEIVGYRYGQRNDALSDKEIRSLDVVAHDADSTAKGARTTADGAKTKADAVGLEAGQAETKITEVDRRADDLAYFLSARRVQDESGLESDLRKEFAGQHIAFDSYVGDDEAYWLCWQLSEIARKAGVDSKDECASKQLLRQLPITDLHISAPTIEEGQRLSTVLKRPHRVPGLVVSLNVAPELIVTVGVKPSVPLFPMVKKTEDNRSAKQ